MSNLLFTVATEIASFCGQKKQTLYWITETGLYVRCTCGFSLNLGYLPDIVQRDQFIIDHMFMGDVNITEVRRGYSDHTNLGSYRLSIAGTS